MSKRVLIYLGGAVVLLVALFFALNSYIYSVKQGENDFEPYRATLSGEYVCLPEKGERTKGAACAFGIRTKAGEYYAIDFGLMSQAPVEISLGERFEATGVVTPIERLSTDHWRAYEVDGIFSVTNSLKVF